MSALRRAQAVALAAGLLLVALALGGRHALALDTATPGRAGHPPAVAPWPCALDDDCSFAQGFLDGGGAPALVPHLLYDVLPCEGRWGAAYDNGYVSAFQLAPSSWRSAASATGYTDPLDPYAVGRNVAWWLGAIDDPGGPAGWPTCWHTGDWP